MNKRNSFFIFLLFYIVLFVLYFPSQNGILYVNDAMLNMYEFENTGWKGILHSYNMIFLWYVPSVFYFICYKLFGTNWLGWHAVLCLFHTVNAVLFVSLLSKITCAIPRIIIVLAAFLFLISPFQTEVVAWSALFHYSLSVTFLLLGLLVQLQYFKTKEIKFIGLFHLFYLFSLFCFEQAFLFPFVYLSFAVLIIPMIYEISWKQSLWKQLKFFFIGNVLCIILYFILTKLNFGVWVAHYGAEAHAKIPIKNMYENLLNYHWKFLFYYRYIPEPIRKYYNYNLIHKTITIAFPIFVSLIFYVLYKIKYYKKTSFRILLFLYVSFMFLLVPVLNLDSSFTFEIQSDRYGYSASLFFYAFLLFTLFELFGDKIVYAFSFITIILCIGLLNNAVGLWHQSGNLSLALIKSYPLQPTQKSFVLNMPDNFAGVYTMRNGFNEGVSIVHQDNFKKASKPIAWVNVFSTENETSTEIINDSTYYVKCLRYGKWYYYNGAGATDYETDSIKVDFDEWNFAYTLTIKQRPKDSLFILQCYGDKWKIIDTVLPSITSKYQQL